MKYIKQTIFSEIKKKGGILYKSLIRQFFSRNHGNSLFKKEIRNTNHFKLAFTLVELIVTLVILSILATISFITLGDYPRQARDSARKTDLKSIEQSIRVYQIKNGKLPNPDNVKTVSSMSGWVDGEFGSGAKLLTQTVSELPKDPVTGSNYEYLIEENGKRFKLRTELESGEIYEVGTFGVPNLGGGGNSPVVVTCTSPQENYNGICMTPTNDSCFTFSAGSITDYSNYCTKDVVIPKYIGGVEVTSVGYAAFNSNSLTSIFIPDTVTSIGDYAFQNNSLTSLTISYGVTNIGNYSFQNNSLTSVIIPSSVTSIGDYAFYNNSLTTIEIPKSIINIPTGCFFGNNLKSVNIPNSVSTIGSHAFYNNSLTSLTISYGVTNIGNYSFQNNSLTSVIIPSSVTSIGNYTFYNNSLTSVTIPSSVTSIGNYTFANNSLISLTIPSGVTSIGVSAFQNNNNLTTVNIPSSVESILRWSFRGNSLTTVNIPNSSATCNGSTNPSYWNTYCFDSGVTVTHNP